jgi:hypothetical protein
MKKLGLPAMFVIALTIGLVTLTSREAPAQTVAQCRAAVSYQLAECMWGPMSHLYTNEQCMTAYNFGMYGQGGCEQFES